MSIIKALNLFKTYTLQDGIDTVLKDINLTINEGEYVAIIGPTGSGKSSLIRILSGLEQKTSGNLMLFEKPIENYSKDALTELRIADIGFVFQSYQLINELTVYENIELAATLNGFVDKDKIYQLMSELHIMSYASFYPNMLSGGTKQRVAIARALINNPRLLFLDEPTGNLDDKTTNQLLLLLKEQNELHQRTLIIITHDKDVAKQAKRVIELKNGAIIRDETNG